MSPRSVLWSLLCCVSMVFASCHHPVPTTQAPLADPALASVDSLMWQQPDSALTQLIPWFDTEPATEYDRHYAHLLLAELLYKNDCEQTNRKELRLSVDYFDSLADGRDASATMVFLDARAHYMNGVGYYERDSVVEACSQYLKAVEIMENRYRTVETMCTSSPHVPRFMALTYNRLGDLFSTQYMMDPAIICYENSLVFCIIEPTSPQGESNTLCRLGQQYDMNGEVELASSYYEKALDRLPDTNNIVYRDICVIKALCDYQLGKQQNETINTLKKICEQAATESERMKRFLIIAYILFEEGDYDSALHYFEPIYDYSEEVACRLQAANHLHVIYDTIGNLEKRDECVRFLAKYKKSDGENMSLVSKLDVLFQSFINQRNEKQTQKEHERNMFKTIAVMVVMSIGIVLTIVVIAKLKSRKFKKHQAESDRLIKEKETKYEAVLARQREKLKEVETHLKEKDNLLKKEKETHQWSKERLLQSHQQGSEAALRREAFLNEPICRKINDNIRDQEITVRNCSKINVTFSSEDKSALERAVLAHYGDFETFLLSKNPRMCKKDWLLCQLYLLGLNERQIAVLLCVSYSTIKKRAAKMKDMLDLDESLSDYILGF